MVGYNHYVLIAI